MAISWDSFDKIWASTSPLTPYSFSDPNYAQGWNFIGSTPPARQMWDSIQKQNDEKFKYLRDNFGTPNIVTQSSQMTDTDKIYVYLGSEAGWNNGHWYYYDEGTSSWADGGVYNSVAFVTDTTLSIAGQPADAKATGDALALKSDLAGCTFTGNVGINADLSVTGDATIGTGLSVTGVSTLTGNVSAGADVTVVGDVSSANLTTGDATIGGDLSVTGTSTLAGNITTSGDISADNISATTNATVGGNLSVTGTSTLTGNINAGADITVVGDITSANISTTNATISGNATVTGDSTLADASVNDLVVNNDLSVAGDSSLTNLSVSGTTALAGTATAPTPGADDNSTKIATTEYVQNELKPIETKATIDDKRISNIEKLLQGNLYDYQTDSTSAYTKTVPAGAMPYASLDSIGGKTVVFNQLQANQYSQTTNGVVFTYNVSTGALTVSEEVPGATRTNSAYWIKSAVDNITWGWITGHKYLIRLGTTPIANNRWYIPNAGGTTTVNINTKDAIVDVASRTTYLQHLVLATDDISTPITYYPQVFDLTLLYGAGNEPSTVEEFQQMFSAQYYSYNAGTLLSAGVTEVVSKGKNLFPNTMPSNKINATVGSDGTVSSATNARTFAIPCMPNTDYMLSQKATPSGWGRVGFFNKIPTIGDVIDAKGSMANRLTFSINSGNNTYLICTFSTETDFNLAVTTNEAQIEVGTTKTTYSPYVGTIDTYTIPADIQSITGYGWSAGSVYNYIDFERKVFVQRVGSVDLGTLNWTYSGSWFYSNSLASVIKPCAGTNVVGNLLTAPYPTVSYSTLTGGADKTISYGRSTQPMNYVMVRDSAYTTDVAFTSAMSGVMLYYELDTPIETDISAYLTDDNLIEVEAGGTLTFPNSNGDDYRIPVPSAETYMVDLQASL